MEKNKATLILKDIMEKLSLIKKEELSQEQVEEQVKEEADMSLKLTEEAVNEEVHLEEVKSEEEVVEEVQEEVQLEEQESEVIAEEEDVELDEEKYVTREQYQKDMASIKSMIEDMKLRYEDEKVSMSKEIEKLSAQPAAAPIQHNSEDESEPKFKFARDRRKSTLDRVMENLINNK
tara:strand:- start:6131 stop:6661 length:531 start_codon:yes stop_codon:yes gene_type:complete